MCRAQSSASEPGAVGTSGRGPAALDPTTVADRIGAGSGEICANPDHYDFMRSRLDVNLFGATLRTLDAAWFLFFFFFRYLAIGQVLAR